MDKRKFLLNGLVIVITDAITKQVRVRKHKKRRIDKKWLKRYGYKTAPDDEKILHMGDKLYMTQKCYKLCRKSIERDSNESTIN